LPLFICTFLIYFFQTGVVVLPNSPFQSVDFIPSTSSASSGSWSVVAGTQRLSCKHVVNAAGLYADRVAQQFGFAHEYTMLPFKGLYLYCKDSVQLRTHIYPVPNLSTPFLGVHFTRAVDGVSKIGPTAIPGIF
jgi:L-2-hydroxyglutarate oxidase